MRLVIPVEDVTNVDYLIYFEKEKLPPMLKRYAVPVEWVDIESSLKTMGFNDVKDVTIIDEDENTISVSVEGMTYTIPKKMKKKWRVGFITVKIIDSDKIVEVPPINNLYLIVD